MRELKQIKFKDGKEMLSYILQGNDLWCKSLCEYVFVYTDNGSICTYYGIDDEKAEKLDEGDYYWGAYLGWEGSGIIDSKEWYEENGEEPKREYFPIDYCNEMYDVDWYDVTK